MQEHQIDSSMHNNPPEPPNTTQCPVHRRYAGTATQLHAYKTLYVLFISSLIIQPQTEVVPILLFPQTPLPVPHEPIPEPEEDSFWAFEFEFDEGARSLICSLFPKL
jgi:hypothetical protein